MENETNNNEAEVNKTDEAVANEQPEVDYSPMTEEEKKAKEAFEVKKSVEASPVQPQPAANSKGMSVASMVLGIVSIVFLWVLYIAIPCGVVAIILGAISSKRGKNGFATAGLITGIIGVALTIIVYIVLCGALVSYGANALDSFDFNYNFGY
ncbi:MAG: DUF4190 domain-containing protein [Christensenellales bacterium]|jgi:hypothetical protein